MGIFNHAKTLVIANTLAAVMVLCPSTRGAGSANLALHKMCKWHPPTNYSLCKDENDSVQLTDGKHSLKNEIFWTQKSTVGWIQEKMVGILVDLGTIQSINEVILHTVSDPAKHVYPPSLIRCLTSEDGTAFYEAATNEGKAPMSEYSSGEGATACSLKMENLRAKGRYALLIIIPKGRFFFCDEIEILKGTHDVADVRNNGIPKRIEKLEDFVDDLCVESRMPDILQKTSCATPPPTTPHIKWAKPHCNGTMSLLIFGANMAAREAAELSQRMDMTYTYIPTCHQEPYWGFDKNKRTWFSEKEWLLDGHELTGLCKNRLPSHFDAIILGGQRWNRIPEEIRVQILKKVETGTGLVCINPQDADKTLADVFKNQPLAEEEEAFFGGFPWTLLPAFSSFTSNQNARKAIVNFSKYGKGRVAVLRYPAQKEGGSIYHCLTPFTEATNTAPFEYEYYMSVVIKTTLWAANKTLPVHLEIPEFSEKEMQWDATEGRDLKIRVAEMGGPFKRLIIHCTARNAIPNTEFEDSKEINLSTNGNQLSFSLPSLPIGNHFIDLLAKNGGQIVGWETIALSIIGDTYIKNLRLDKKVFGENEPITGKIILNRPPEIDHCVTIGIFDNDGRLIHQAMKKANAGEISFAESPRAPFLTNILKIEATLSKNNKTVNRAVSEFIVKLPPKPLDEFKLLTWNCDFNYAKLPYLFHLYLNELKRHGVDAGVTMPIVPSQQNEGPSPAFALAKSNIGCLPYVAKIRNTDIGCAKTLERNPCLTDIDYNNKITWEIDSSVKRNMAFTPTAYSLGDENHMANPNIEKLKNVDFCFSKTCREDFRLYLKNEYKNLEALNSEWSSHFGHFDEINPITLETAKKIGNDAAWVDHRMHMETVFANAHRRYKNAVKNRDPTALVSIDGAPADSQNSFDGYDWSKLLKIIDCCFPYQFEMEPYLPTKEIVRSLKSPHSISGLVYGAYFQHVHNEDFHRFMPWNLIFHGHNAVLLYNASVPELLEPAFKGDFSPYPWLKWNIEEIKIIKNGIDKLLLNCKRENDGVYIHYSQSSLHAGTLCGDGTTVDAQQAFCCLMEDCGLQYDFITYDQIESGNLRKKNHKALLLPYSQCLSSKETAEIKNFVQKGGLLLADRKAGLRDEHGKPLDHGSLDDVFGIKSGIQSQIQLSGGVPQGVKNPMVIENEKPTFVVNKYGSGWGIYLNFSIEAYLKCRMKNRNMEMIKSAAQILMQYGAIESQAKAIKTDGDPATGCETVRFTDGKNSYVGLLQGNQSNENISIEFPAETHVYNILEKKYCGHVKSINISLPYARGNLFARLPYKISALSANLPRQCRQGDEMEYQLSIETEDGRRPQRHVFHVAFHAPDGKECIAYTKNVTAPDGRQSGKIQFALNETTGRWKIRATDVASGAAIEKAFSILPGAKGEF
ncbi:MAG: beta-galactosidase [Verrucomicrobiae bacterium]|nr:beta-galactosidase [Verrucomicrobiae bacterium]